MQHHRALTAAALLGLTACGSTTTLRPGPTYPSALVRLPPSNIQLVRSSRHIEMTNTTVTGFGPSRLWLNQWYSAQIEPLPVGESMRLPLSLFRDEFGDAFRGGGFFAAEAPDKLVKAELELERPAAADQLGGDRVLLPLIVVGDQE
jgi:hypothetical protein